MKKFKIEKVEYKRILGRNVLNAGQTNKPLALFWGASALEVNIKATEIWINISADYDTYEPWIAIEVNGYQTSRFMISKGKAKWIYIARNLNQQKENLISIIKDTQPMPGDEKHSLLIHAMALNDDGIFCPLKERPVKIEFIGDSITSGEGLAGKPDEMDWITQWFCASKTFAMRTARDLNADWSMLSQCGWGLCWGWDGNRNSQMKSHYEEVCSVMGGRRQDSMGCGEKWEFGRGSDYVVLNLGTNDNSAFSQPAWKDENGIEHPLDIAKDGEYFSKSVADFLSLIRKHNPKAKIIWTWGMMKLEYIPSFLLKGIEEYKKVSNDENVFTLEYEDMNLIEKCDDDRGSRGHPGPKTHKLASEKLINFINSI